MIKKTRGTVTFVCGVIASVSGAILLILRLGFGEGVQDTYHIPMCIVWVAIGIYLSYLGRNMRRNDRGDKDRDDK